MKKIYGFFLILFAAVQALPRELQAQAEVPVLADAAGNPQVMFLIDDSGSMNAIMEHEDFDDNAAAVNNAANDIPSVIFRLESGASAPSSTHQFRPILIELNEGFRDSSSGNLYASQSFSNYASLPVVAQMTCNNSSGSEVNCPNNIGSATTPRRGANAGVLFNPSNSYNASSKHGASIYTLGNLAQHGGTTVTDSSGHEYLYVKYRKEDWNLNQGWNGVWANINASGVNQNYQTRVFATAGGTVKFNNREVFLSAGWYRIEYLRWIFYVANSTQLAKLPGQNRLRVVKNVVQQLITDNPTVRFGLAAFNSTSVSPGVHSGNLYDQWFMPEGNASANGPKIRRAVGTASASLISSLNSMTPRGGTPLTNSYIEVLRYFHGETDNDPNFSGTYTSPINSACDAYFIVVLTDGLPSGETANSVFGSFIRDYDGDGQETGTNQGCNDTTCPKFLDDAAYFAFTNDFSSSLPGMQNIRTYGVGLGLSFDLLNSMAEKGGTGQSYEANTVQEINDTLRNIVNLIITSPVAGAGAALAETFGETGKVYRPRFRADTWNGNIDVYNYNPATDKLDFQFDIGDLLEDRNISTNPRKIFAGLDTNEDGRTSDMIAFSVSNAATLRPRLFKLFHDGTEDTDLLEPPFSAYTTTTAAENLIKFIHGQAFAGARVRDRDGDGKVEKLGDIVYSRPVEVGPRNGNYNGMTGYAEFTAGLASQPRILLVGANDGMLHAFDSETGEEIWGYIPSSQLKYLERLTRVLYNANYRRAYVDGPVAVEDAYIDGPGGKKWRTLALFGLRTGGSTYTVLDITDRRNPQLIFEVSDPSSLGQSWSKPIVVPYAGTGADPANYSWYMVVGTGEGKTTAGTNIARYNLDNMNPSANVTALSASDPAGTRTSSVVATQNDRDLNADRLYVGTEEGDMFRVRVGTWAVTKLYDGAATHPIVAPPLTVLVDNPSYPATSTEPLAIGVYWGTGRYDERVDTVGVGATSQRIIGVFDPVNTVVDNYTNMPVNLNTSNLQNQSPATFAVRRDVDKVYRVPAGRQGFYIDTATSISPVNNFLNPTGMAFYEAVNLRGALFISTFLPNQGQCAVGGHGFLQALNFRTGGGFIVDYNKDPASPFYNGGVPDMNGDGAVGNADLVAGINSGKILPAIDVKISQITGSAIQPYKHSGTLTIDDVRLHTSNGGIVPAVSSLGDQGAPVAPSILKGAQRVIIQPAYPVPPTTGNPSGGAGTPGGTANPPSASLPPPEILPINIYNLPLDILSFHESTGE